MNYIELINAAWELREQGLLSPGEHDLYNYLLHKCNRFHWKNSFGQSTEIICATLGITRNMLTARRAHLRLLGLITYKEGRVRSKVAEYTLLDVGKCIKNDTLEDTCNDTCNDTLEDTYTDTLNDTLNDTILKTKQNKTKQDKTKQERECTHPPGFQKPTYRQVADYCLRRNNRVDARSFMDFYDSKGWMIGRNRMADWQAAVRRWERDPDLGGAAPPTLLHGSAAHNNAKRYEEF
jgi:hypothetical protein